jgi:MinD superfamily P-loop ATPase
MMRGILALSIIGLWLCEANGAELMASYRLDRPNATFAQSYCAMCAEDRTACTIKCNGAGACIQACDNDFLLCRERACGRRWSMRTRETPLTSGVERQPANSNASLRSALAY